jgi:hypothetical protein
MNFIKKDKTGLFKSIFTAYFILLLHVFLLAGVGVSVVLFRGFYHYLPWIMGGIAVLVLSLAFIFYRRMKTGSSGLKELLSSPGFQDREVEVRVFGGLASFRLSAGKPSADMIAHTSSPNPDHLLIGTGLNHIEQQLLALTTLYEKNLITKEEFETARQNIIQG